MPADNASVPPRAHTPAQLFRGGDLVVVLAACNQVIGLEMAGIAVHGCLTKGAVRR
jgi:hypothetical protein